MALDYYDILGVSRNASDSEIKRAYRQRARALHPDVNRSPDALNEFQELQQAHATLSDPEKRARYDAGETEEEWVAPEQPPAQDPSQYRRRAWNTSSKFDPAHGYVDTDYAHYARACTIVGLITFIFASTFLIDFIFSNTENELVVLSVKNKWLVTNNSNHLPYMVVETTGTTFTKDKEAKELVAGELVDLKSSLIYGFKAYKRSSEASFQRVTAYPLINYILALIVYIAALNALFNKKRLERKFNAAIVASFFSVMLLVFALVY